jgi:hypothetical protein
MNSLYSLGNIQLLSVEADRSVVQRDAFQTDPFHPSMKNRYYTAYCEVRLVFRVFFFKYNGTDVYILIGFEMMKSFCKINFII